MAAKGYATVEEVAAFLGVTFTAAQEAQAERMLETAEAEVDGYTNRGWLVGAQTDEAHPYSEYRLGNLYLRYAPVTSIATVKGRPALGDAEETLVADTDYEVMSLETGWVRILYPASWDRIRVTYTPTATAPLDIQQATAELAAHRLRTNLMPGSFGVYQLGLPDLNVTFRQYQSEDMPLSVINKLDRWRYWVVA